MQGKEELIKVMKRRKKLRASSPASFDHILAKTL
jgi:hypothetical protein